MDFERILKNLLASLPPRPISKEALDKLVIDSGATTKFKAQGLPAEWEYLLKKETFELAATEGAALKDPKSKYFDQLYNRLDLVLTFSELELCDYLLPVSLLEDLFEMQTVASCVRIFDWLELRSKRITVNMVPAKLKALTILRSLNSLLKRVSRTGSTASFCGRILNFLSGIFPIGEKSGVNLRGEYGPAWDNPIGEQVKEELKKLKELTEDVASQSGGGQDTKMADATDRKASDVPKPEKSDAEKKLELYDKFWSLQLPFSQPLLFAQTGTISTFKANVEAILPVIAEATKKERLLIGTKGTQGAKRKRGDLEWESYASTSNSQPVAVQEGMEYFFAKYLTSPDLLDLELSDTHFRRQVLFQILILMQHLQAFSSTEKTKWITTKNRSLQMDFTLKDDDARWIRETWSKVIEELRATAPNGRSFSESVAVILERDKGWVRWKNEVCPPIDKPPVSQNDEEDARVKGQKFLEPPPSFPYALGTRDLSSVWEMGYQDLKSLERPMGATNLKAVDNEIKRLDKIAEAARVRQARMAAAARAKSPTKLPAANGTPSQDVVMESAPTNGVAKTGDPASSSASDVQNGKPAEANGAPAPVAKAPDPNAEQKRFHTWRGLRLAAQGGYLHLFGKIGSGDIGLLLGEIKKEQDRPKPKRDGLSVKNEVSPVIPTKGVDEEISPVVKLSVSPESDEQMAPVKDEGAAMEVDA